MAKQKKPWASSDGTSQDSGTKPLIRHKFEDAFGDDTCETCGKNRYWHEHPKTKKDP